MTPRISRKAPRHYSHSGHIVDDFTRLTTFSGQHDTVRQDLIRSTCSGSQSSNTKLTQLVRHPTGVPLNP
ncbi:hypothetical protein TIFTF001_033124 [Ficus carica]|uniref:Uncharacterized protein n=1 Tax=Ficus carica TaxID=3494 RepID=A0AA88J6R0_FICCA|nr:hypothetical protein TIFTF001_033124 [Ficus carica]